MKRTNCPNCGAPITGFECEYCGTRFYDMADMEIGEEMYLRIKANNNIITTKAVLTEVGLEMSYDSLPEIEIRLYATSDIKAERG